ncbi:MAG: hypothetical protein PHF13_05285, partial [Acholeplasmataceae bacterium]|nr:hypothetical protein [Acholeplasmataceae bacterium]
LFLENRTDLPIILSLSTWIMNSYRLVNDGVVYGEATYEEIEHTRELVLMKIDFFEKLFIIDYFIDHKTTVE